MKKIILISLVFLFPSCYAPGAKAQYIKGCETGMIALITSLHARPILTEIAAYCNKAANEQIDLMKDSYNK
jgi:hypothetical protein